MDKKCTRLLRKVQEKRREKDARHFIEHCLRSCPSDAIPGGLGKDSEIDDFDPVEVALGIGIELEHTDDICKALDITKDHLTEIPDYNSRLIEMEKEVGD